MAYHLDRADHDALERVAAYRAEPGVGGDLAGGGGEVAGADRVAGERAGQKQRAVQPRVQRGGVRDLLFDHVRGVLGQRPARARRGARGAGLDGVAAGLVQRQQLVAQFEVGKLEGGYPAGGGDGVVQRGAQPFGQGRELGSGG